jgi:hypothetical protein
MDKKKNFRMSGQYLLPGQKPAQVSGQYDIYPSFRMPDGLIHSGTESLARMIANVKNVIIDGYAGVFFGDLRESLDASLKKNGIKARWFDITNAIKSEAEINELIRPFLGGEDPLFGTRAGISITDFFDPVRLGSMRPDPEATVNILTGTGAALADWDGMVIYADLPKNELQFRARAGSITNLGATAPADIKSMYKRFYFIDWVILNEHKRQLLPGIDIVIDDQVPGRWAWMEGEQFREALRHMGRNMFRVRPWFEPGVWGGKWIMDHIRGLNRKELNYAWSFELITPENGLLMESSGELLEVSFDFLMYQENMNVLGKHARKFGYEFPLRFDFLDTFEGGNLSVQCHPRPRIYKKPFRGKYHPGRNVLYSGFGQRCPMLPGI